MDITGKVVNQTRTDVKTVQKDVMQTDGKKVVTNSKVTVNSGLNIGFMSDLSALRYKLEAAEAGLIQDLHVPLKENSVQECSKRLVRLQVCTNITTTVTVVANSHRWIFYF